MTPGNDTRPQAPGQPRLDQEQALANLDQSIADREQAIADREQNALDIEQTQLEGEIPHPAELAPAGTAAFTHRQHGLDDRQARADVRQEQIDGNQAGAGRRQLLLDSQQEDLELSPSTAPDTADGIEEKRRARAHAALQRAASARERVREAALRAEAAEERAQLVLGRDDADAQPAL